MNLSGLENKYVLVTLYGVSPSKRPESAEKLHPMLCGEWEADSAVRESELNRFIQEVIVFGKQACELNQKGIDRDSLEYDSLKEKAKAHSDIALQFALQCYTNGALPIAVQGTMAETTENIESDSEVSNNHEAKQDEVMESNGISPSPNKERVISSEDLLQSIMNNSGTREKVDVEWEGIRQNLMRFRTWRNDLEKSS